MHGRPSAHWTTPFKMLNAPVRVHLGWLLVAVVVGWSLAMGSLPVVYAGLPIPTYWAMSAIIIIGLGLSVLLQALAHTLAGRAMGVPVDRITVFAFGGYAELHEAPRTALSELGMALAGPLLSVGLCGAVGLAAGLARGLGASDLLVGSLTFIATLNLVMAFFNLLPVYPLDGGRAVRAVLWMITGRLGRATWLATRLGLVVSVLLMATGAVQVVRVSLEGGVWTLLIGLFLHSVARGAETAPTAIRDLRVATEQTLHRDARRRSIIAKREEWRVTNVRHSTPLPGSG